MARSLCRVPFFLIGAMSLAMTACGGSESPAPDTGVVVADAAPAQTANQDDALSPEAWSAQTRAATAEATPEDMAAEAAAAGRAMAETCGFTAAEMDRFKAQGSADQRGPGFEARVEAHMPRLRQAQQAQQRENSAAYQENCEFLRFMMDNRH